jgi:hypothetical protein
MSVSSSVLSPTGRQKKRTFDAMFSGSLLGGGFFAKKEQTFSTYSKEWSKNYWGKLSEHYLELLPPTHCFKVGEKRENNCLARLWFA